MRRHYADCRKILGRLIDLKMAFRRRGVQAPYSALFTAFTFANWPEAYLVRGHSIKPSATHHA